jgi:cell division protein FtsN
MTEKTRHSQLELFCQGQDLNEKNPNSGLSSSFWVYIGNYEKIILIIIGFIITGIISFCLGVERGKTITSPRINSHFDIAQKQESKSASLEIGRNKKGTKTESVKSERGMPAQKEIRPILPKQEVIPQPQAQDGGYTIQVASYQTRTNAEKETEKLKKKGFSALILSKGEYIIVCVGNFSNKETAKSLQLQLRQNYQDCYIRRL